MTVIYSNFGDRDTLMLQRIWRDLNCNVIEIGYYSDDFEEIVDNALANEDDTLIMCGHGTSQGLLHPNLDSGQYIIHQNNAHLIHARNVIGLWCWASEFAETHNLHGFFSGMFISNLQEAEDNFIHIHDEDELDDEIRLYGIYFMDTVHNYLVNNTPLNLWISSMQNVPNSYIASFNQNRLRYYEEES